MRHLIALAALALVCTPGTAAEPGQYDRRSPRSGDQFIVGIECSTRDQHLEIGLFDADNLPDKRVDLWDTWDLKKNKPDGDAVEKVLTVVRACTLGSHRYRIEVTGKPANWNLKGECGSLTYAKAKVWKDRRLVFDEDISSCADYHTLKLITFYPHTDEPVRKKGENLAELLR